MTLDITTDPEIKTGGDLWIVRELESVRLRRRVMGGLPAFRRGLMHFDFDAGKVRITPTGGAAA